MQHAGTAMPYQPIENYGVIGNLRTAALVGMDGSVDWLCLPNFDSPSVFAAILDDGKGGRFRIAPSHGGVRHKQFYWPDTNVLVTRFLHPDGIGEIEDYMPVGGAGGAAADQLVRRVRVVRGRMPFRLECRPAFDYARGHHETHLSEHGARFDGPGLSLGLASTLPLARDGAGVTADFTLGEGESTAFLLRLLEPDHAPGHCPGTGEAEDRFRETVAYWRRWLARCTYRGRWRETVQRSALALKLLTFAPTGAIVAAPTTSLPEGIGGRRNWDYGSGSEWRKAGER
jgi:GH15 family glucan-1,4-alpha-glucosidase